MNMESGDYYFRDISSNTYGHFTNAVAIKVYRDNFSDDYFTVTLIVLRNHIHGQQTNHQLVLSLSTSPPRSLTNTMASSRSGFILNNSDDPRPHRRIGGLMDDPNNYGPDDELTATRSRLDNSGSDNGLPVNHTHYEHRLGAALQRIQIAIPDFNPVLVSRGLPGVHYSAEIVENISPANRVRAEEEAAARVAEQATAEVAAKAAAELAVKVAAEAAAKLAAEAELHARWDGSYIVELLETKGFNPQLVDELKAILNMIKHMNIMLFKHKNEAIDWKIAPSVIRELEKIAVQVIHYFDEFGKSLDRGIDKIHEVKPHLPSLGPETDPYQLRQALRVWNARLMKYFRSSTPSENHSKLMISTETLHQSVSARSSFSKP